MDLNKLDELYHLYKFQKLHLTNTNFRVYAYTSRYFSNADIITLGSNTNESQITEDIKNLGYTVNVRHYKSIEEAENGLFKGFFDIENSLKNISSAYQEYTNKISQFIIGEYEYIPSEYFDGQTELTYSNNLIDVIQSDFLKQGPVLVLLEAAAGFGKTSTSYEILNSLIKINTEKIPLFTELSRNRQATIFKYVLYDEINRKFPGINLELVIKHIIDGRIPIIIDGFDELLKSSKDNSEERYQDIEPMLETIKELLKGEAKVLLTTRKTAIFAGDDFHIWIDKNSDKFSFKKYEINAPTISHWITPSRQKILKAAGLNLLSISNPVLLSYMRSMDDNTFIEKATNIEWIIENYMQQLLEREKDRQELIMSSEEQKKVLEEIAGYFVNYDITSESKDAIEKLIINKQLKLLVEVTERYSADRSLTVEQLATKLSMHVFLDRKNDSNQQIGFVNDFLLGTFSGINLLNNPQNWICSDRFIDFILTAYAARSLEKKNEIYNNLDKELLSELDIQKIVLIDNNLLGVINHNISNQFIENLEFTTHLSTSRLITNCIFSQCNFREIIFEIEKLVNVAFINCSFHNCEIDIDFLEKEGTTFTNCTFDPPVSVSKKLIDNHPPIDNEIDLYEKKVLERFWPSGRERLSSHKLISTLRLGVGSEMIEDINRAINNLIRRGIILESRGKVSLMLNLNFINEIKKILGR